MISSLCKYVCMYMCRERERVLCVCNYICIDGGIPCVSKVVIMYVTTYHIFMHMCVYLYIARVVCLCEQFSLHGYICIRTEREVSEHVTLPSICKYICIHVYICVCVRSTLCIYICVYMCVYIYIAGDFVRRDLYPFLRVYIYVYTCSEGMMHVCEQHACAHCIYVCVCV